MRRDEEGFSDDPQGVLDLLQYAAAVGCPVLVGYDDPDTGYQEEVLEVVNVTRDVAHVRSESSRSLQAITLSRVEWAQLIDEQALSVRP